ncbi:MAG TPA: ATP-dependent sacrificial sulfur transferase LarE [Anaeromyxobacteraceae bacterium]|nr:ATP-dependent sacrificial sulfur transferase LarE [Anaeromyxobacteraceae bacterium]
MPGLEELRRRSQDRLAAMKASLGALEGALVAFSGGVDSTFVLAVAREVLGDRALALTAHSPSVPHAEREEARALARRLGARHVEVESHEGDDPRYAANPVDRCYYCKSELYRLCGEVAQREGIAAVLDGFNADDRRDHRPGHRAAEERRVRSPLAEAGLVKDEVRAWSEAYGLPTWDKPQMACLASRLPYGTAVTPERLAQVERAEAGLRALGLRNLRVRYHGEIGRVEVAADELEHAFRAREAVARAVREAGFRLAVLDLEPFRSGRLNELAGVALPVVA